MTPFVEVAGVPEATPLDLWGGWDGRGFDRGLYLSTGARQGGDSRIFRHDDRLGDASWVDELFTVTETVGKIRDGLDPQTGLPRLWAFVEGPGAGQSWLAYRSPGSAVWAYEDIPHEGNAVGGRGLGVDGLTGNLIYAGGSEDWSGNKNGKLYRKAADGTWSLYRSLSGEDTLLWEVEFEGPGGARWEFWNHFAGTTIFPIYRDDVLQPAVPGEDISHAAWFPVTGHLYVIGDLSDGGGKTVYRFIGGAWVGVYTFPTSTTGDHVVYVPRGAGELWAVGMNPLQVARSLDGTTWEDAGLPEVATGVDSNHLTALGYYCGRVWVAARSVPLGTIRMFREALGSACAGQGPQVI